MLSLTRSCSSLSEFVARIPPCTDAGEIQCQNFYIEVIIGSIRHAAWAALVEKIIARHKRVKSGRGPNTNMNTWPTVQRLDPPLEDLRRLGDGRDISIPQFLQPHVSQKIGNWDWTDSTVNPASRMTVCSRSVLSVQYLIGKNNCNYTCSVPSEKVWMPYTTDKFKIQKETWNIVIATCYGQTQNTERKLIIWYRSYVLQFPQKLTAWYFCW